MLTFHLPFQLVYEKSSIFNSLKNNKNLYKNIEDLKN